MFGRQGVDRTLRLRPSFIGGCSAYYNPGRTTILLIATIKKIAGSVLTPISRVRGISSAKKGGSFVAHFNPYTLHPGSSIFFIVALAKLVVLPGL